MTAWLTSRLPLRFLVKASKKRDTSLSDKIIPHQPPWRRDFRDCLKLLIIIVCPLDLAIPVGLSIPSSSTPFTRHECAGLEPTYLSQDTQNPHYHSPDKTLNIDVTRSAAPTLNPIATHSPATANHLCSLPSPYIKTIITITSTVCGRTYSPITQNVVRSQSTLGRCDPRDPGVRRPDRTVERR